MLVEGSYFFSVVVSPLLPNPLPHGIGFIHAPKLYQEFLRVYAAYSSAASRSGLLLHSTVFRLRAILSIKRSRYRSYLQRAKLKASCFLRQLLNGLFHSSPFSSGLLISSCSFVMATGSKLPCLAYPEALSYLA